VEATYGSERSFPSRIQGFIGFTGLVGHRYHSPEDPSGCDVLDFSAFGAFLKAPYMPSTFG